MATGEGRTRPPHPPQGGPEQAVVGRTCPSCSQVPREAHGRSARLPPARGIACDPRGHGQPTAVTRARPPARPGSGRAPKLTCSLRPSHKPPRECRRPAAPPRAAVTVERTPQSGLLLRWAQGPQPRLSAAVLQDVTFHGDGEETPGHVKDVVGKTALSRCTLLGADARVPAVPPGRHFHHALLRLWKAAPRTLNEGSSGTRRVSARPPAGTPPGVSLPVS